MKNSRSTLAFGAISAVLALAPALANAAEHSPNHDGKPSGLPQLDPAWYASEAFWLTVHFIVLYVFTSKVILPRIEEKRKRRQIRIAEDMTAAEKMNSEAKQIRHEYESELAKARSRANKIRVDTVKSCKEANIKAEETLNSELADRMDEARARIERESAKTRDQLQTTICDAAQNIIKKISGQDVSRELIEGTLHKVANNQPAPATRSTR